MNALYLVYAGSGLAVLFENKVLFLWGLKTTCKAAAAAATAAALVSLPTRRAIVAAAVYTRP